MWWLAHGEQEVPVGAEWLAPREQRILAEIRYPKRRVEFLTRRWTAKRAVAMVLGRSLDAAWAEPEAFAGCSSKGQQSPDQPQPIQIVRCSASTTQRGASA